MKSLLAAVLLAPGLALAADPPKATSTPTGPGKSHMWEPFSSVLEPQKDFEVCTRMEKGETRRYHWKSDAAVDFNIHYHRGKEVFYPVKRSAMRGDGGGFTAKEADEYCWMWTARNARAKLGGRLENPSEVSARAAAPKAAAPKAADPKRAAPR
jgi:hypothetical protein